MDSLLTLPRVAHLCSNTIFCPLDTDLLLQRFW